MTAATAAALRRRRVKRLAWVLCILALAVVGISAYVRLDAAGFGCADWPACYGEILAGKANLHSGIARPLHRLGASVALLLGFLLAWLCLQPQPLQPVARRAVALVLLMMVLAAVGIWSSDPHRAFVTFFNILGGLALVSLSWRVVLGAAGTAPPPVRNPWLAPGLAALLTTLALGALIGARYAAVSCQTLPACGDVWWPTDAWAALNPFAIVAAPLAPGDSGGSALHLLHRYSALATLALLVPAAHRALRQPSERSAARVVLALLAVEVVLGLFTVASGFNLWLGIAHSATAAALIAAAASLRTA